VNAHLSVGFFSQTFNIGNKSKFTFMKKSVLFFICFILALRAVNNMMIFCDLNTFLISNESAAFHSGQIAGLTFKVIGSLGLSLWLWKKYTPSLSK
jgi:hypothetical protein